MRYNTFNLFEENEESIERILINADILKKLDNRKLCTVGGLLIFGKSLEKYLHRMVVALHILKAMK